MTDSAPSRQVPTEAAPTVRVIRDGRYRGTQNYRLQVAPATVDDGAPGIPLQNGQTARGSLNPRTIDVRDVYRFASPNRSMLTADLRNAPDDRFDLMLLTDTGSPVDCACDQAGPVGLHRSSTGAGTTWWCARRQGAKEATSSPCSSGR